MRHKLTIASLVYCVLVLLLDVMTPLGLALGYFYLPVLFIVAYKGDLQVLKWCCVLVITLTILGGVISYGNSPAVQLEIWGLNRGAAIVFIILAYTLLTSYLNKVNQLQEDKVVIDNIINSIGIDIVSINLNKKEVTHLRGGDQFNFLSVEKSQSLAAFYQHLGPNNGEGFAKILNEVKIQQKSFEYESDLLQVRTNEHWYRIQGFQIRPKIFNCIVQDVSLRGDSEYGTRNLNALLDILPCFVWTASASGNLELINQNLSTTLQFSKEQIKNSWQDLIHPDDKKVMLQEWAEAVANKKPFKAKYRLKCRDGKYIHAALEVAPIFDNQGQLIKWLGSGMDISAIRELRQQQDILNGIASATQDSAMVFKFDSIANDYRVSYINRAFEGVTGFSPEDSLQKHPIELLKATPLGRYDDKERFQLTEDKAGLNGEGHIVTKDGTSVVVDFYTFVIDKQNSSFLCVFQDKTKEKRLDAIVARNKRMDSIGHLTGGIAHDFNNLLAVISGNLELIKLESNNKNVLDYVNIAIESANQGAKLTSSLLQFAKGNDEANKDVCGISDVLNTQRKLFSAIAGPDTQLSIQAEPNLFAVINEVQFESVIINLISNAKGALLTNPSGFINVLATQYYLSEHRAREIGGREGDYVKLEVTDNGTGMSEEQLDNIFSPFYSTKSQLKGTGLGLSMIYAYIRQNHGFIDVRSKLGEGSSFEILLRAAKSPAATKVARSNDVSFANFANKTVLLVEDKHRVAEIAKRHLTNFGFNVIEFSSATLALNRLTGNEVIDLIFTDISMPGDIDGYAMVEKLTDKFGSIPVIFVSGFFGHEEQLIEQNGQVKMKKPYTKDCLAQALNKVMI